MSEVYLYLMWRPREEALEIVREHRDSAMAFHGDGPHRWRSSEAMARHNRWVNGLEWLTDEEKREMRAPW